MTPWTPDECRLLRTVPVDIGALIACGEYEIEGWRAGTRSGGHYGVSYEFTKTAIVARFHEQIWWDYRRADGTTERLCRPGEFLRDCRIGYKRLLAWAAALPDDIREQARAHYATYPVCTRDLGKLRRLVLELIPDPGPLPATADQRKPVRDVELPAMPPADHFPADLLELLEMTNA